jgi:tetratricopeptide (TPR) repeat protein
MPFEAPDPIGQRRRTPVSRAVSKFARVLAFSAPVTLFAPSLLGPATVRAEDEPLVLEEETTVTDAALSKWLSEGMALLERQEYLAAAIKFNELVRQGDKSNQLVQEAQYLLGATLYELGLYQSAFTRFEEIVDAGAGHARYDKTLGYLLKIARATGNDPSVLLKISEYPQESYPPTDADELNFLVGQFLYGEESLAEALGRFESVSRKNRDLHVRARYLEGVILVAQSGLGSDKNLNADKLSQAAEAFKAVLTLQRDEGGSEVIDRVAADAILALGRLFYSTRQYDVAVKYYDEIAESNPNWLESIYEVSWVHFQLKNYPRALGNLHTVNSPYFASQYFPESRVLQALILFYNCHYDDVDRIVKEFVNDYYPLMTQFKAEINQFADPNAFYFWLARLSKAGSGGEYSLRFKRIFNAALEDKKLRRKFEFVSKLNDEVHKLEKLGGKGAERGLIGQLKGDVEAYRSLVIGEAGGLAQGRLLRIVKDLQRHLGSALKIKGETLRARRGDISNAAAQEQAAAAAAYRELEIDEEHIEWPFEGEYWRDELGAYLYETKSRCEAQTEPPVEP